MTYPVSKIYEDMEREAKKNIHHLIPKRFLDKIKVENIVVRGTPFIEIIKAAKKYDIDLITIATHGRTGISHALLGSTAEKVVRRPPARCYASNIQNANLYYLKIVNPINR